jgi:hypothetical protein
MHETNSKIKTLISVLHSDWPLEAAADVVPAGGLKVKTPVAVLVQGVEVRAMLTSKVLPAV